MGKRSEETQARVLTILQEYGGPMSAYEVLAQMRENSPRLAPLTIYRALSSLMQNGCVHRLESLNAFMACQLAHPHEDSILSICDDCGVVEERLSPELVRDISGLAGSSGFVPTRHVIEVHGHCAVCGKQAGQV